METLRSDANTPSGKAEECYQKAMETQKVMESNPSGIAEERYRKDERKREEMAGKRLQTLANVMAMEMMGRMLDRRIGPADLLRVSDSIDDRDARAETPPTDHADGPTDTLHFA